VVGGRSGRAQPARAERSARPRRCQAGGTPSARSRDGGRDRDGAGGFMRLEEMGPPACRRGRPRARASSPLEPRGKSTDIESCSNVSLAPRPDHDAGSGLMQRADVLDVASSGVDPLIAGQQESLVRWAPTRSAGAGRSFTGPSTQRRRVSDRIGERERTLRAPIGPLCTQVSLARGRRGSRPTGAAHLSRQPNPSVIRLATCAWLLKPCSDREPRPDASSRAPRRSSGASPEPSAWPDRYCQRARETAP
jgi:hypothetical protein